MRLRLLVLELSAMLTTVASVMALQNGWFKDGESKELEELDFQGAIACLLLNLSLEERIAQLMTISRYACST